MSRHTGSHHGSHHSSSHHNSHRSSHHRSHHRSHNSGNTSDTPRYSKTQTDYYKYRAPHGMYYSENDIPAGARYYNGTWLSDNDFDINMDDPYAQEHYSTKKTTKFYRALNKNALVILAAYYIYMLGIAIIGGICSANVFYELVIPVFENADMSDIAFYIADTVIYYIQFVPVCAYTIGGILYLTKGSVKSKEYERSFANELLDYYSAFTEIKQEPVNIEKEQEDDNT